MVEVEKPIMRSRAMGKRAQKKETNMVDQSDVKRAVSCMNLKERSERGVEECLPK